MGTKAETAKDSKFFVEVRFAQFPISLHPVYLPCYVLYG